MNNPVKIWRERKYRLAVGNPGKLVSFSQIYSPPMGFEKQTPYYVGLLKLKNGSQVMGQIVNSKKPKIGQKMKVVLRILNPEEKEGVIDYGLKFKPWEK